MAVEPDRSLHESRLQSTAVGNTIAALISKCKLLLRVLSSHLVVQVKQRLLERLAKRIAIGLEAALLALGRQNAVPVDPTLLAASLSSVVARMAWISSVPLQARQSKVKTQPRRHFRLDPPDCRDGFAAMTVKDCTTSTEWACSCHVLPASKPHTGKEATAWQAFNVGAGNVRILCVWTKGWEAGQ